MFYFTVGPLYQKIVTFTRMMWRRERLDKNQMFFGLSASGRGGFLCSANIEFTCDFFYRGPLEVKILQKLLLSLLITGVIEPNETFLLIK